MQSKTNRCRLVYKLTAVGRLSARSSAKTWLSPKFGESKNAPSPRLKASCRLGKSSEKAPRIKNWLIWKAPNWRLSETVSAERSSAKLNYSQNLAILKYSKFKVESTLSAWYIHCKSPLFPIWLLLKAPIDGCEDDVGLYIQRETLRYFCC